MNPLEQRKPKRRKTFTLTFIGPADRCMALLAASKHFNTIWQLFKVYLQKVSKLFWDSVAEPPKIVGNRALTHKCYPANDSNQLPQATRRSLDR
jgi:hypothetical protein